MIELKHDQLSFSFPEVHPEARVSIDLQRTLRIPDDGLDYPLPAGLGTFPLRHVDDFASRLPEAWKKHGGVMLPMYQSEALWINLHGRYPFAVKVATGKINALTGENWTDGIHRDPQDYMVTPDQPWLDGYCVEKGTIRQFVAMPLGGGYTVEEQITGEAEHGGLQIVAYPMKDEAYQELYEREEQTVFSIALDMDTSALSARAAGPDMGLAPGGRMKQEIFDDPHAFDVWDTRASARCFVHISNSLAWRAITGEEPPTTPLTSLEYQNAGLPWFDYYGGDREALEGAEKLEGLKTVKEIGEEKGELPLPENETVEDPVVITLGVQGEGRPVREGGF
jgi:hypothetical protein